MELIYLLRSAAMKVFVGTCLSILALAMFASLVRADDATKEVTLKGTLVCTKCTLHETDSCANALKVKDGDKETIYYLTPNDVSKGDHKEVCHGPKEGVTVTGTVEEKDGKKWLTATKIDLG
jgi:hypothetical protein